MTVFAVTRSCSEIDIIEQSIRRMCAQVDHVIIGDNSTDGGHEVLQGLVEEGLPITLYWEDAPNWHQPEVVKRFVLEAYERGADWVVPFDLDEVWTGEQGSVAMTLMELPEQVMIAPANLLNHTATLLDDVGEQDPFMRLEWRGTEILPLRKVAFRPREDVITHDGNHSVAYEGLRHPAGVSDVLGVKHFPYRSPEQFVKRVEIAWPQIRDSGLGEGYGTHVWVYGRALDEGGPEALHKWFNDAFFVEDPDSDPMLTHDPLPPCPPA